MDDSDFFERSEILNSRQCSGDRSEEQSVVAVNSDVMVDSVTQFSMTPENMPPDLIAEAAIADEESDESTERLTLAYERLFEIPRSIVERFADHIKYLDISHNKVTNLDTLVYFKNLTSLIADDNPINEDCHLPPLPNLQLLWLNHCKIKSLFPWIHRLRTSCPNLQYLCLMGNPAAPSYLNGGTFYEYLQYRLFVISQFPSLLHLDDRAVSADQRSEAQRLYRRPLLERLLKPHARDPATAVSPSEGWSLQGLFTKRSSQRNLFI